MTVSDYIGQKSVFFGVYTQHWTLAQFQAAADWCAAHAVSGVFIKVADGGINWYTDFTPVRNIFLAKHILVTPYTYSYGGQYLENEIQLALFYMRKFGIVCVDMEVEWNGHPDWAATFCKAFLPVPGVLLVTTWADPDLQAWDQVITTLNPCVNGYIPQVYSNALENMLAEYNRLTNLPIITAVCLSDYFGPNDPVRIASLATQQKDPALIVWEYQLGTANEAWFNQTLGAFALPQPKTAQYAGTVKASLDDEWNETNITPPPRMSTGIHDAWCWAALEKGKRLGPPTSAEVNTTNFNGKPIIKQHFDHGWIEWDGTVTPSARVFTSEGEVTP